MSIIDEHICLFFLADKLNRKDLSKFYIRMCTALSYDNNKIECWNNIYASYGLFDSQPLSDTELKQLYKLAKCKDCTKLRKLSAYKAFDIEKNACNLCKHSDSYRNHRIREETHILRYLMKPNVEYQHIGFIPDITFYSVNRLSDDYAIGTHPIVALNFFLYKFLEEHPFLGNRKKQFKEDFCTYIYSRADVGQCDLEDIRARIFLYIEDIIRIDENEISDDRFHRYVDIVSEDYSYCTNDHESITAAEQEEPKYHSAEMDQKQEVTTNPSLNIPTQTETLEKREENLTETTPIPDATLEDELATDTENDADDILAPITFRKDEYILPFSLDNEIPPSEGDPGALSMESLQLEQTKTLAAEHGFKVETSEKGIVIEKDKVTLSDTEKTLESNGNIQNNIGNIQINNEKTLDNTKNIIDSDLIVNNDSIMTIQNLYLYHSFSPANSEKIITVTSNNMLMFLRNFERSYYVSIEPTIQFNHGGLLLYTSYQNKYYFYDIEIFGGKKIDACLQDTNIRAFSFHPLHVKYIIQIYEGNGQNIIGLDILYWLYSNITDFSVETCILDVLGTELSTEDVCIHAMPLYADLFDKLNETCSSLENFTSHYRQMIRSYDVLSRSLSLQDCSKHLVLGFHKPNFLQYSFYFNWGTEWKQRGMIFRIEIPEIENTIHPDSLAMDTILLFDTIQHHYKVNTRILSITSKAIYLFFKGDMASSRRFYDVLMMGLQRIYTKHKNKPLVSNSYCVLT